MRKTLLFILLAAAGQAAICQIEASDKAGLLMNECSFDAPAEVMVLRDEGELSLNNDYSLRLDRKLTIKFFKEKKIDAQIAELVFYPSPLFERYYRLVVQSVGMDALTKGLVQRDHSTRVTSIHLEQTGIKMKRGELLEISYSINFPYDEKIPDWHFQSVFPTEFTSVKLRIPEIMNLRETIGGGYTPEVQRITEAPKQIRVNNQNRTVKVSERYYQFTQMPSVAREPFSDNSPRQLARMRMRLVSLDVNGDIKDDFVEEQVRKIIETLSSRTDFILRLAPALEIKSDYDRRIRTLTDRSEKMARIYDLVRRHIIWDHTDSLSARRSLSKVWEIKKGNSAEVNLALIKLLQVYGFDAEPLLVSTRGNGIIDTDGVALSDFNRVVACVNFNHRNIILDASGRYFDYPMMPSAILNTRGLLISMNPNRWIELNDTSVQYKNQVTLLGHLSGDSSFLTNVYVNSTGYAKAEHVEILETDSLKGLRRCFERVNPGLRLKHFIAANEYVDTLPLAQEFDIRVPLNKTDNLCGVGTTWFAIPDTLFGISENRKSEMNFGYRQEYDLVSEFSFPDNYEIYLVPGNMQLSAVNGIAHFEREYHAGSSNFSLKQSLVIDRSCFNTSEAIELAKFFKKVASLNNQQVVLKKNY